VFVWLFLVLLDGRRSQEVWLICKLPFVSMFFLEVPFSGATGRDGWAECIFSFREVGVVSVQGICYDWEENNAVFFDMSGNVGGCFSSRPYSQFVFFPLTICGETLDVDRPADVSQAGIDFVESPRRPDLRVFSLSSSSSGIF